MADMFVPKQVPFNLRNSNLLALPPANTVQYGTNSVFFRGALLWNTLPKEVTVCEKLTKFKGKLSSLGDLNCSCKLCK